MNIDRKEYGRFDPMQRSRDFLYGPHPRAEARRIAAAAFGTTDLANQTQGSGESNQGALPTFEQQPQPEGARVGQLYVKRNVGALDTVNASITDELGNPIMVVLNTLSTDKPTPGASGFITQRGLNLPLSDAFGVATDNAHAWISSPLLRTLYKFNGDDGTLDPTTPQTILSISGVLNNTFGTGVAGAGTSPLQFNSPRQVSYDASGRILVADTGNNRILILSALGAFIQSIAFANVFGVCGDPAGNIYAVGGVTLRKYNSAGVQQGADVGMLHVGQQCFSDGTNLWVTAQAGNAVHKFTTASPPVFITLFGTTGSGDGQFNSPIGIGGDATYIYVADNGNSRVQAFNKSTNAYSHKWDTRNISIGLIQPVGLAVAPVTGNVYTSDNIWDGVVEWSKFGVFRRETWPGSGSGVGQLGNPLSLAVDASGNSMIISDNQNHRLLRWGIYPNDFIPYGVHVDKPTGKIYACDKGSNYIWGFTFNGYPYRAWGYGTAPPNDCTLTGAGGKLWAVYGTGANHQLVRFGEATGLFELAVGGAASSAPGMFDTPLAVTLDAQNNVWVADYGNDRIQQFDPEGVLLHVYGESGSGDGQLDGPSGLEFDDKGNLWVVDHGNDRIQIFDQNFTFLSKYGTAGLGTGQWIDPWHIAISDDSVIYVTDGAMNARVARLRLPETSMIFLIDDEEINDVLAWRGTAWVNRGGGEFLIGTAEFSSSAGLTADGLFGAEFDEYRISGFVILSVFGAALYARLRVGGVELVGANYSNQLYNFTESAAAGPAGSHAVGQWIVVWPIGGGQINHGFDAVVKNPYRAIAKTWRSLTEGVYNGVDWRTSHIGGFQSNTALHDGLRIFPSSGVITSGWLDIFGRTT